MLVPSGFSTMGWETGAVLGAAVAAAGRPVVGVLGDGAFNSTVTALATAAAAGVSAVWLVLDNHGYQSISAYQDRHFGRRIGTDFEQSPGGETFRIDYVGLARAYGAEAEKVTGADQLEAALKRALAADGNYLIEVPTAAKVRALASGQWDVNAIAAGDTGLQPAPLG
jgi:thiamine pyrophosphate-dependent acetolactate synthase large subunit-like protein